MTRRERLEAKYAKRLEWAGKAEGRSNDRFDRASRIADNIPLGQPILVGHHSERHARADQARIHSNMDKAVAEDRLAKHHAERADGIERALDNSIFSDDTDALDALRARIAENEAKRDRMKRINTLYRKGDAEKLKAEFGLDLDRLRDAVANNFSWDKRPYASYALTNLGARIRSDKKLIADVEFRQKRTAQAEASPSGISIEGRQEAGAYVRVTFADKPERSVIDALKAAGYYWNGGGWVGAFEKMPEEVRELIAQGVSS